MDDAGRVIEATIAMADAPAIGRVIELDDPDAIGLRVRATRIASQVRDQPTWKPYISHRLPRFLQDVPCTPSGKPIITSQAQETEIKARFGYERE
jgi:hypothetical protein